MAITFDPLKSPEENLANFWAALQQQDPELGQLLESRLHSGTVLSAKERTSIAKQAIAILNGRAGGGSRG